MSDDQILGYVLGALDAAQRDEFEQRLLADPELAGRVERFQRRWSELSSASEVCCPPPGLADRTCEAIWGPPLRVFAGEDTGIAPRNWGVADVLVAVAVSCCVLLLLFPAVSNSRYLARKLACQYNQQRVGEALIGFAQLHNHFPHEDVVGEPSWNGNYAGQLLNVGLVTDVATFRCPEEVVEGTSPPADSPLMVGDVVPDVVPPVPGWTLQDLQSVYGYRLPLAVGQGDRPLLRRAFVGLASDPPVLDRSRRNSQRSFNHGSWGQNVLFESGSVRFVAGDFAGNDHLLLNADDEVGPSKHINDAVIVGGDYRIPLQLNR